MIPWIYYVLGYHELQVDASQLTRAADALLRAGVSTQLSPQGCFVVPHHRLKRTARVLGTCPHTVGPLRGLFGASVRLRRRYGLLAALVTVVLLWWLSGRVVWDVRVKGELTTEHAVLLQDLAQGGVYAGAKWRDISFSEAETRILASSDTIAWLSIDRRGHVAYVSIVERMTHEPPSPPPYTYANIVAARDGVVDEVLVHGGHACVKPGDTVRQGDILIAGALPEGGLCLAQGEVTALVEDTVSVLVPDVLPLIQTQERRLTRLYVNFFGFSVNILKNDGNSPTGCAIIEETKQWHLFGRYALPVTVMRRYTAQEHTTEQPLTADEMAAVARARLSDAVRDRTEGGELVRIRTEGAFEEGGYRMTAYLVYRAPIGTVQPISVGE